MGKKNKDLRRRKFDLFGGDSSYYFSEGKTKANPHALELFAVSAVSIYNSAQMGLEEICFLLAIDDIKYFELSFMQKRLGWHLYKIKDVTEVFIKRGYLKAEKPKAEYNFYKNKVYKVATKYYPTPKAKQLLNRIVGMYRDIVEDHNFEGTNIDKEFTPKKSGAKNRW